MAFSRRLARWRSLLPFALLTVGTAYTLASWNWCGAWTDRAPAVVSRVEGSGPLLAGAAKVALQPPFPVVVAGYPPPRAEASQSDPPTHARAVVLEAGGAKVGVVSLDLLLVPGELVTRVRERVASLGLSDVLVVATHTHSSFGGYDTRWVAQLVGTGRHQPAAVEAIVAGASEALQKAAVALVPVTLEVGSAREPGFVYSRTAGETPDGTLTRAVLRAEKGPLAELLVFAAHPTLVPRQRAYVDPDYPGRLSELREARGEGVTLVLQGAVGNASVAYSEGQGVERAAAFARVLSELAMKAELTPVEGPVRLSVARAEAAMPRPDASRMVPSLTRAAGDNLLCSAAPRGAEVSALALGPLELVTVPGEPTTGAGAELVKLTGATGVLGLAGGYVGYVETPDLVTRGLGESHRQYFGPLLLERLAGAARVASEAAGFTR